ncbi:MAG: flavodoxin family protein [Proteobacteria bacterium]|nr:flavodoxin family protein [Pseudomonadota bacterium]
MKDFKVKILGISGTPIKGGNCEKAVHAALDTAAQMEGVETEFISLADKKIAACIHCQYCVENQCPCKFEDDAAWIIEKMVEADGMIWGAPVWTHSIPPQLINLISRCRYHVFFTGDFRNIVLGVVTVSWMGVGEEFALLTMESISGSLLMIPVARGWGKVSTLAFGQRPAHLDNGVLDDPVGMVRIKLVGTRVAEIAQKIKYAGLAGVGLTPEEERSITCGKFPHWHLRRKLVLSKG